MREFRLTARDGVSHVPQLSLPWHVGRRGPGPCHAFKERDGNDHQRQHHADVTQLDESMHPKCILQAKDVQLFIPSKRKATGIFFDCKTPFQVDLQRKRWIRRSQAEGRLD